MKAIQQWLHQLSRLRGQPVQFYWAYGSNMSVAQMRARCPDAEQIGALALYDMVLRFRGVADVAYFPGAVCQGGLYRISRSDEKALDDIEGATRTGGLYKKEYFHYEEPATGQVRRVLYYRTYRKGIMPPTQEYYDTIKQGYLDFGVKLNRLEKALDHSWNRTYLTKTLKRRYQQAGQPALAERSPQRSLICV